MQVNIPEEGVCTNAVWVSDEHDGVSAGIGIGIGGVFECRGDGSIRILKIPEVFRSVNRALVVEVYSQVIALSIRYEEGRGNFSAYAHIVLKIAPHAGEQLAVAVLLHADADDELPLVGREAGEQARLRVYG